MAPTDETRNGLQIGSIVAKSDGQKAQKEMQRKEIAESSVMSRESGGNSKTADAGSPSTGSPTETQGGSQPPTSDPPTHPQAPAPPSPVTSTVFPSPDLDTPTPSAPAHAPAPASPTAPLATPSATIVFAADSAEIAEPMNAELARIAKRANDMDVRQIQLHAYAGGNDIVESRNLALARALRVRGHLIDKGVKARIEVHIFRPPDGNMAMLQRVDLMIPGM